MIFLLGGDFVPFRVKLFLDFGRFFGGFFFQAQAESVANPSRPKHSVPQSVGKLLTKPAYAPISIAIFFDTSRLYWQCRYFE